MPPTTTATAKAKSKKSKGRESPVEAMETEQAFDQLLVRHHPSRPRVALNTAKG